MWLAVGKLYDNRQVSKIVDGLGGNFAKVSVFIQIECLRDSIVIVDYMIHRHHCLLGILSC